MVTDIQRVAIYARVSTEEQAKEGFSITAQLQTLRQYAQIYNWEVVDEYVDEGISGKSVKGRPEMKRLMKDVENERFDAVIVWKISRLSRNMLDTLTILDKFEKNNVKFVSYSENFDTSSPIGRLVLQIMASIAEMERNTLSENVKLGMKQRALEGLWNGGVIFGYDIVKKQLVINDNEAELVQLIYQMYADGKGLRAISNHLNKSGYKTKRNKHFSINGVAQILDNVVYNGKISWLKVENWETKRRKGKNLNPIVVEGKHQAIVSNELWNIVQARRNSKSFKQRQSNEPFLLSKLLRCPDCGQGMVPSITTYTLKDGTKRKHRYYVCSDFHNKGSAACKANSIKAYEAEEAVIQRIEQFSSNKKQLSKTLTDISSKSVHRVSQLNKELGEIEKQLKEIERLQEKYMEAFEKNILPVDILQERLQKVSNEKRELERAKNEIIIQLDSVDSKLIQPELIEKLLEKFLLIYKQTPRENQKQLLQLLIDNISIKQIDKSRTIKNIELEFDFTELHISKTFTLIHLLYRETDNEHTFSIPASDKELPPYLQQFLPLFVVRFTTINPKQVPNKKLYLLIFELFLNNQA
jgi:site-specific DNA recombinase